MTERRPNPIEDVLFNRPGLCEGCNKLVERLVMVGFPREGWLIPDIYGVEGPDGRIDFLNTRPLTGYRTPCALKKFGRKKRRRM